MVSEEQRVATLKNYGILDTPVEAAFDALVTQIATTFAARSAVVSFIDEGRQWYKARYGVDAPSVSREDSFCTHSLNTDDVTVIADARLHPLFRTSPFVTAEGGVRFYAAAPIKALNRARLGTVCIFDPIARPEGLTEREKRQLSSFAARVLELLEQRRGDLRARDRSPMARSAAPIRAAG